MTSEFISNLAKIRLLSSWENQGNLQGRQALYIVSVHPRVYLAEHTAAKAVPYVPCGTGTPEFSVLSEALSKIKKSCPQEGRNEN